MQKAIFFLHFNFLKGVECAFDRIGHYVFLKIYFQIVYTGKILAANNLLLFLHI